MFIAALFMRAKRWKQPKCLSMDDWINKMWSVHTMEYYSAIKRMKLWHASVWMNQENIMFSERSQAQNEHILCESVCLQCAEQQIHGERN